MASGKGKYGYHKNRIIAHILLDSLHYAKSSYLSLAEAFRCHLHRFQYLVVQVELAASSAKNSGK